MTIADNAATGARGGGLTILDLEFVLIEDSIIARNTGNIGSAAVVIAPSNCSVILPSTGGGNVESGDRLRPRAEEHDRWARDRARRQRRTDADARAAMDE